MMEFYNIAQLENRKRADLLVIPYWKGKKRPEPACQLGNLEKVVAGPLEANDFLGKEGEIVILYPSEQSEARFALLGLGDPETITVEKLRRAYASLIKGCRERKVKEINLIFPRIKPLDLEACARGIAEGILLPNYVYTQLKHDSLKDGLPVLIEKATFVGAGAAEVRVAKKYRDIAEGVYLARDLINGNADDVFPSHLGIVAKELAHQFPQIKTTIFDKKWIEKQGMGLLLAVNQGSNKEPAFIISHYKGDPSSKQNTVLVGKGITYDTGGLNLKPTGFMETMKSDMSGAATVLGTLHAVAKLKLPINLIGVIPAAENAISANSFKPGDVYRSYTGKTVEIGNTDAEGRLILADALAYAVEHLKPTRIIDFATLTGAVEIALGNEVIGLLSNQDALADALLSSGFSTYERLCRLPLYEEYREALKSEIADIRNIGGRPAGTITAAMFLQEFVGDTPWAHCDIAGTAYSLEGRRYIPKLASGIGVRLMADFLEKLI